jgi:hypothetical protein
MNKLFLTCPVILIAAAAFALQDITLPTGGGFYEGTVYQPRTIAASNITAVTPRFIGELLLGKESGSNAVWHARGLTTNDWSLITAEGGPFSNANISDLAATKLTGNIAVARMTNAAGTLGSSIGGNIPVAALTNGAGSLGASIGGNIPVAALTNGAGTLGSSIGGAIPAASITNAAGSIGSYIGGNIPIAALTNATGSGSALCAVTNKCIGYTNIITFIGSVSGTLAP